MRKFEIVKDEMRRTNNNDIQLPIRGTKCSAGYDFFSNTRYVAKPNEVVKIWTDIKAIMNENEVLLLDVRSSMSGKWMLANTIGVIDSDYVNNESNDGNIGFFLKNISDKELTIEKGDRIGQGIFIKYLIVDNDETESERKGGFGSTN